MSYQPEIRRATLADVPRIFEIYRYWAARYADEAHTEPYFSIREPYTLAKLEKIVGESEATVAVVAGRVVSFYFINCFFDPGDLPARQAAVQALRDASRLPAGRYALCLLSGTDADYLGQGLNNRALQLLRQLAASKYDYFFGTMAPGNLLTQRSSLKMGWQHYHDANIGLFGVIATDPANTSLNL